MSSALDLTTLLGSRICHDLVSPLGAISNGVELLEMSGSAGGPEMALIAESVSNANARIRFFRIAFGAASPDQKLGRREVVSILGDLSQGSRMSYSWGATEDVQRADARLIFLLLQCFETAMPYGGSVTVEQPDGQWRLRGETEKLNLDPALFAALEGGLNARPSSAHVHFALVPLVAEELGVKLSASHDAQRLEVIIS